MNKRSNPPGANESASELPPDYQPGAGAGQPLNLDAAVFRDVQVSLSVKLGETTLRIEELLELTSGAMLKLDRHLNEPVELYLNESLVGRGEIVAVDDCFGIRVTEISAR